MNPGFAGVVCRRHRATRRALEQAPTPATTAAAAHSVRGVQLGGDGTRGGAGGGTERGKGAKIGQRPHRAASHMVCVVKEGGCMGGWGIQAKRKKRERETTGKQQGGRGGAGKVAQPHSAVPTDVTRQRRSGVSEKRECRRQGVRQAQQRALSQRA